MQPINDRELESLHQYAAHRADDCDIVLFAGTVRLLCEEVQAARRLATSVRCLACWRVRTLDDLSPDSALCAKCRAYYAERENR